MSRLTTRHKGAGLWLLAGAAWGAYELLVLALHPSPRVVAEQRLVMSLATCCTIWAMLYKSVALGKRRTEMIIIAITTALVKTLISKDNEDKI